MSYLILKNQHTQVCTIHFTVERKIVRKCQKIQKNSISCAHGIKTCLIIYTHYYSMPNMHQLYLFYYIYVINNLKKYLFPLPVRNLRQKHTTLRHLKYQRELCFQQLSNSPFWHTFLIYKYILFNCVLPNKYYFFKPCSIYIQVNDNETHCDIQYFSFELPTILPNAPQ